MSSSLLSETVVPGLFRCLNVKGNGDDALRLKRLGICAGRKVEVMQTGDPMVLNVVGTQVGVSRIAAELVVVEPIDTTAESQSSAPEEN